MPEVTPTREQVEEWARDACRLAYQDEPERISDRWRDAYDRHLAALAFAAGAAHYTDLLRRCRPIVQADADMMADITRHSPLDPQSQAVHDATEYESERLLPLIDAALEGAASRPVTGADVLTEEECIQIAAQCWCDPETARIEMDSRLAMAFAKRLAAAARIGAERERERVSAYLRHTYVCERLDPYEPGVRCTCGLDAAIRRGEGS